jgi:hypothetical protein
MLKCYTSCNQLWRDVQQYFGVVMVLGVAVVCVFGGIMTLE